MIQPETFDEYVENMDLPDIDERSGYLESNEFWDAAVDKVIDQLNEDINTLDNPDKIAYAKELLIFLHGMK